jgi:hypothetical protein
MDVTMSDDIPRLENLPAEIIHRIALFLPCSSILPLSFTSRALHKTCYDKIVFRRNAKTVLYEEFDFARMRLDDVEVEAWELESCASEASAERSEDEDWWPDLDEDEVDQDPNEWDHDNWGPKEVMKWSGEAEEWYENWPGAQMFERLSVDDWAKIAFAVEKARLLLTEREEKWNEREEENEKKAETERYTNDWATHNMQTWLPHLLALRHPAVFILPPAHLQLLLEHPDIDELGHGIPSVRNPSRPDDIAATFSMVVLYLHDMELNSADANFLVAYDNLRKSLWKAHPGNMSPLESLHTRTTAFQWQDPYAGFDFSDVYGLLLHLVLALYPHRTVGRVKAPVLHRMPVCQVLGTPVPFRSDVEDFVQSSLNGEEMVQYLCGEWVGLHTGNGEDDRDPPFDINRLYGIKISARSPSSSDASSPDTLALIEPPSPGKDNDAKITFRGSVSSTGIIVLNEASGENGHRYRNENSRFRGVVTPFGIVGLWEAAEGRRNLLGHFWIWKREWCV